MEKYAISAPNPDAGLSNRIKCLISVMRLADNLDRKVLVYWPTNFSCGAHFSDLFDNSFKEVNEKKLSEILSSKDSIKYTEYPKELENKKYLVFDTWRFITLPEEVKEGFAEIFPNDKGNNIDLEFDRIPTNLRKIFLKYLFQLKPKKEILDYVKSFSSKNNLENAIGLHVRRNEFLLNKRGKVSSDDLFFEKMDKILSVDPNKRFFLATDSKKTEEIFKERYPNKIIIMPKKDLDRNNPETIKEALIELLLLSKTNYLLGTYLSTFTELAWWFGGCKAKVEIIGFKKESNSSLKKKVTTKSKILNLISRFIQYSRRNSSLFRDFLRLIGKWG